MKNIQIILNAILSQDVFEYILIDRNYKITGFSEGVEKYVGTKPELGGDVLEILPELVGYEERVDDIFNYEKSGYVLETIHKNDYYINLHLEHYDKDTALLLLHNTTEITLSKLELLQYTNENALLYSTIKKILDSQNNMLFLTHGKTIEYANKKFLDYFSFKSMDDIKDRTQHRLELESGPIKDFDELYEFTKDEEQKVKIGNETFLVKATLLEKTYKLFTLTNITSISNINENLQKVIDTDPLTGIYRKQYFDDRLKEELEKGYSFTVVVADIDNFKKINDKYGHIVGDNALKEFTDIIKNNLRKEDIFSRWGGEEFLILIRCYNREVVVNKIENIRRMIEEHEFENIGHMTASFGIAISNGNDTTDTIFNRADKALYQAKKLGRNRVVVD